MRKGVSTAVVFMVVAGAISLFIGIWIISIVNTNVVLPTGINYIVNESINFAANDTYYPFAQQPSCLSHVPQPPNCGVETGGLVGISNETIIVGNGNFTYNETHIAKTSPGNIGVGSYDVTYYYYEYSVPQANTALETATSTVWNAFTLLAVGLIVIAAATIIGYFYMRK